ncbi:MULTISPECIES: hypothetical protein [Lacticaseibacillus]|jgi:hypothetical protein|uniref:Uncharacterized protein n=8 Tax=Lacticaseibacillus TaxID=2759736 RepID=A0AAN1F161_LACCA|nr:MULTISPECIES: hypothetical protein [Lacticaseibacillus]OFR96082.1 hypothetical protein HMPREF2861_08545 [Lactobacillus sp. HMSC068F07]ARY92869.1 hypothetical protein BGL52_14285 [Lacticaseibacillus casei]KAB1970104.1 hypothetical protein F9B82_07050 [Lacticaseibacillus casei]KLI75501.1 hypothetical protein AAW28_08340 [Lacticaseibacillus casei]KRK13168.1 hypothetical protein FD51_GL001364 [Lacticaseibacillus zeae DSM 20178 = KCTC 3804]
MNIYSALKFIQIDHAQVNHLQVVVTDQSGKPDAGMTDLLIDCLNKIDIFVDLSTTDRVSDVIDDLNLLTPLPYDVLEEYQKILEQPINGINVAMKKQLIEFIYAPTV